MKIWLDENLPVRLKSNFGTDPQVFIAKDMKWLGIKKGALMNLILLNEFDIFITCDTNLQYQQLAKPAEVSVCYCCAENYIQ